MHAGRQIVCAISICLAFCTNGRVLSGVRTADDGTTISSTSEDDTAISLEQDWYALHDGPLGASAAANLSDVSTRLLGINVNKDWRPYAVLAVGELLGYIVRSITGENPPQSFLLGQKACRRPFSREAIGNSCAPMIFQCKAIQA